MPLITLETIHPDCKWALWEITESFEELSGQLDLEKEAEKTEKIKNDLKKREKIAGRVLLKQLLESWGEVYHGTGCDVYGKPMLKNHDYHISISHSHGCTVAIVDKNYKIGIDIELIKENIVKIAPRVFSSAEIGQNGTDLAKLVTLWTMKESLYKLYGERGLDFRENIKIPPFTFKESGEIWKGEVITNGNSNTFNIKYFKYKGFMIAYILNA
jgi:4'-phosphopantetheinyl transferase